MIVHEHVTAIRFHGTQGFIFTSILLFECAFARTLDCGGERPLHLDGDLWSCTGV